MDPMKACQIPPLKGAKILSKMELMMETKKAIWKVQKMDLCSRSKRVGKKVNEMGLRKVYLTVNMKVYLMEGYSE